MSGSDVTIVRTGTANIASVVAAFSRLGRGTRMTTLAREVEKAPLLVLPGVSAFGAAMDGLREHGLVEVLAARIRAGRPTLCVCVGLQVLAAGSEETPGSRGLGVIETNVTRFTGPVRVPQLGWNGVVPGAGSRLLTEGWAYFANSYKLDRVPEGWSGATAEYGGGFVAGLERGNVLACQFHPELSGTWGVGLLSRWLAAGEAAC